jgi:hypothetical protein
MEIGVDERGILSVFAKPPRPGTERALERIAPLYPVGVPARTLARLYGNPR